MCAAVRELVPGAGSLVVRGLLTGGRRHTSWVLDTPVGPVVGKLITGPSPSMEARLREHRRAWQVGVPVTRILAFSTSTAALGPDMVVVAEFVAGTDAEAALPSLEPDVAIRVMRDAGGAIAALHGMGALCFGDPERSGADADPVSWAEYVGARAADLAESHRRVDGVSEAVLATGRGLVVELAEAVSSVVEPVPVHGDVYLPNLLLSEEGRFVALLDLEHMRWLDPIMDFVKPAMWMFGDRPDWAEAYAQGYETPRGLPRRCTERFSVCMGLELLTGVEYWQQVGNPAMAQDYSTRLRRWVDSGGAVTGWLARSR